MLLNHVWNVWIGTLVQFVIRPISIFWTMPISVLVVTAPLLDVPIVKVSRIAMPAIKTKVTFWMKITLVGNVKWTDAHNAQLSNNVKHVKVVSTYTIKIVLSVPKLMKTALSVRSMCLNHCQSVLFATLGSTSMIYKVSVLSVRSHSLDAKSVTATEHSAHNVTHKSIGNLLTTEHVYVKTDTQ